MSRKPDEIKEVKTGGHKFEVEVWKTGTDAGTQRRAIVTGPKPGVFMFHSFHCKFDSLGRINWADIESEIRQKLNGMDKKKFDQWYGPKGYYTMESKR